MYGNAAFATRPYADLESLYALANGAAFLSASFDYVIYAATQAFAPSPSDTLLPSQPFRGTLSIPLNFRRSILGNDIGTFTTTNGTTNLDNADGGYDFLPQTYSADGRPIEIKIFRKGDDYSTAFTIFKGVMASWVIDESTVTVNLQDFSFKLTVPSQANLYGGTGGVDGGADLAQKPKPLAFGYVLNVSPPSIDAANLVYQVNDGPVNAIPAVYDRASALTPNADYASYAALIAATIPAGNFATCLALALFRLASNPVGTITADVQGDKTGGTFAFTSADIVRRVLARSSSLADPPDLYTTSFDAMNAAQGAPIGYWLDTSSTETVAATIAAIMHGIGGWGGFRRNGLFELGRYVAPTGAPVASYSRLDIIEIQRQGPPTNLTPPAWRQRVPYQHNWTVQTTDVAGSVTADRKTFLAAADRLSDASSAAIKLDHPFAADAAPVVAFFRDKADSDAEAARILSLYEVERAIYVLTLPRKALYLNLGDTIQIVYPRFDLSAGRLMTVVEISEDLSQSANKIDHVVVTAYG